jgi:hypothetical protein
MLNILRRFFLCTFKEKSHSNLANVLKVYGHPAIDTHKILCVSQIFAPVMFADDYGTKNPYQNSLSL